MRWNTSVDAMVRAMQLAAVRSGVEGISALVLNNCMKICLLKGHDEDTNLSSLTKAIEIWGRVRSTDNT